MQRRESVESALRPGRTDSYVDRNWGDARGKLPYVRADPAWRRRPLADIIAILDPPKDALDDAERARRAEIAAATVAARTSNVYVGCSFMRKRSRCAACDVPLPAGSFTPHLRIGPMRRGAPMLDLCRDCARASGSPRLLAVAEDPPSGRGHLTLGGYRVGPLDGRRADEIRGRRAAAS